MRESRAASIAGLLSACVLGMSVSHFSYYGGQAGLSEIGLPGHDSFYHVKMASLLPTHGLLPDFPWLRFCYFTEEGRSFVSHHFGFHLLLAPFVAAAKHLVGDEMAGGRWANMLFFGFCTGMFWLLLHASGIRNRWMWLVLFLFLPFQFFTRHAFVRAMSPSLACMLWLIWTIFRGRYWQSGVVVFLFSQLYLGGVIYAPLIVVLCAASQWIAPEGKRQFPWRLAILSFVGWIIGVWVYPYSEGTISFLRLQVFGSGLSPDIAVGQEWNPYENLWWFAQMSGALAAAWMVSVIIRLRWGPQISWPCLALLLIQIAFFLLTLKARRFIEYWPPLCLLSAAHIAGPKIDQWIGHLSGLAALRSTRSIGIVVLRLAAVLLGIFLLYQIARGGYFQRPEIAVITRSWPLFAVTTCGFLGAWLASRASANPAAADAAQPRFSDGSTMPEATIRQRAGRAFVAAAIVGFAAFAFLGVTQIPALQPPTGNSSAMQHGFLAPDGASWMLALALVPVVLGVVAVFRNRRVGEQELSGWGLLRGGIGITALGIGLLLFSSQTWAMVQKDSQCKWKLSDVQSMMNYVQRESSAGDVIFTDDWDIFPIFFFYNSHNHYIVGLDPKFTHQRRPDLWERYVKISRGQVPADVAYKAASPGGESVTTTMHVRLEDIREHFGCRYAITDRDHRSLAEKLSQASHFAELVYPTRSFARSRNEPFLVFRIKEVGESPGESSAQALLKKGILYLSDYPAESHQQGWGELGLDQAVSGDPIHVGGKYFDKGLGTHAPSRIQYRIPDGFQYFEATVGLDRGSQNAGSVFVKILGVDEEVIFQSDLLTHSASAVYVRLPLHGRRMITLVADATADGDRFDHVSWADAKFVVSPAEKQGGDPP